MRAREGVKDDVSQRDGKRTGENFMAERERERERARARERWERWVDRQSE